MKTFITDIIPKIQRFSDKLDNLTLLTNQHWVLIDNLETEKQVYLFRPNNELLISKNGKVEKGKWEYLGNKSLLIDQGDQAFLFKHGFFDENLLALKIDSKDEYALFVNENKYNGDLNSSIKVIEFLTDNYLFKDSRNQIENQTGIKITKTEREPTPEELKEIEQRRIKHEREMGLFKMFFFGLMILLAIFLLILYAMD
ncbi:MAG: hypothetical protein KIT51_04765 [Cyclobacteriaceae bacterium]|nr:MAG: hypothetical protein KIT51_04730 [Cyclobacteriaceae bacterium]UYN87575.1 MAG: hypothetical protein KIT51_04765 [Cyclobacteriaceae bacterium]